MHTIISIETEKLSEGAKLKLTKEKITYQIRRLYYRESMGWLRTVYRGLMSLRRTLYRCLLNLPGFTILLCLYAIKPFKFVKLCPLHYNRIGELAGDTDVFLRHLQLENTPKKRILYLGISGKPANEQLLRMFKRKFPIIQSAHAVAITNSYALRRSMFYESITETPDKFYILNNTETNLHFTESEEGEGKELLNKMGIDDNSWFVCFHSRDSVYLDKYHSYRSREKWSYHDYINSDIENYLEAAKYVASLGGFAVRMGYGVAKKLPDLNNPRIIDYASYYRTDFGDVYLPAKCKFFLGCQSGLRLLSIIFHVPVAWANVIPLNKRLLRRGHLFIPKKIWCTKKKRILTFGEILESEVAHYDHTEQYAEAGLEVVENTPEEILDLAREMNERLDGNFEYTKEDEELQKRFHSLFQPHHNSYGSPARIGAKFLRQNRELLK